MHEAQGIGNNGVQRHRNRPPDSANPAPVGANAPQIADFPHPASTRGDNPPAIFVLGQRQSGRAVPQGFFARPVPCPETSRLVFSGVAGICTNWPNGSSAQCKRQRMDHEIVAAPRVPRAEGVASRHSTPRHLEKPPAHSGKTRNKSRGAVNVSVNLGKSFLNFRTRPFHAKSAGFSWAAARARGAAQGRNGRPQGRAARPWLGPWLQGMRIRQVVGARGWECKTVAAAALPAAMPSRCNETGGKKAMRFWCKNAGAIRPVHRPGLCVQQCGGGRCLGGRNDGRLAPPRFLRNDCLTIARPWDRWGVPGQCFNRERGGGWCWASSTGDRLDLARPAGRWAGAGRSALITVIRLIAARWAAALDASWFWRRFTIGGVGRAPLAGRGGTPPAGPDLLIRRPPATPSQGWGRDRDGRFATP